MATRRTADLRNQVHRDLRAYAQKKVYDVCRDVVQSFEIAGLDKDWAGACLGQLFMRMSSTIAVEIGPMGKAKFMGYCDECYDLAVQAKKQAEEEDDEA